MILKYLVILNQTLDFFNNASVCDSSFDKTFTVAPFISNAEDSITIARKVSWLAHLKSWKGALMQTQLQTNLNQLHVVQVTFDTFLLSETKTDGIFTDE